MKKLKLLTALILISLFLASCGVESSSPAAASASSGEKTIPVDDPTDDPEDPVDDPVDPIDPAEVKNSLTPKFVLTVGDENYLSDGISIKSWITGKINIAGPGEISIDNELITVDASGDTTSTTMMAHAPTKLKRTENGLYYCVTYDPDTAYEMGGQRKPYTEFFKDGDLIGDPWYYNQFECAGIRSAKDNVFAIDQNGAYRSIDSAYPQVSHAEDNRFFMHDIDIYGDTIGFNGITESFFNNYVINTREWILFDGTEYGETGATWTEHSGLVEFGTVLQGFNAAPYPIDPPNPFGEPPVLLKAGQSGVSLYWIECNSGWLFEYDPSSDALLQSWRLYLGDGLRITGIDKHEHLKPLIVDDQLYFSNDGSVNRVNLADGLIDVFYTGDGEVWKYD